MLSTILCPTQMVNGTLEESLNLLKDLRQKSCVESQGGFITGRRIIFPKSYVVESQCGVHYRRKNNFPQKSCCKKSRWVHYRRKKTVPKNLCQLV
jgi:hypothetical protein